ncbi:hypothetical protein FVO59_12015 [Microbacterium esteraromaticum]|uniref:Uncharacterized protein n=1 Tax=Microbacterium esteraromaticum TaxID=57043 RepID=A0A7D7WGW0_9MICO|nr:hypothetical protein [Microbacterium esteraromaticum]QMU97851.1 hypothetical protein FVO59_12015 [Microbacterium esteraromaticum]
MVALIRRYQADSGEWVPTVPKRWDGYGWSRPVEDYTTVRRSPFDPYLAAGTVFQRDVSQMPLATKSVAQAQWMRDHINYGSGYGPTALNTSVNGTHPVQVHLVDSRIPGMNRIHMTCGDIGVTGYGAEVLSGWVPWPKWLDASSLQAGQDSSVVIVDLGSGLVREYYYVEQTAGYTNRFTAWVGGISLYNRDLIDLAERNYPLQLQMGRNTVVRMHNWAGWIDIAGARRGVIDHAVAFTCANMALPDSLGEAIDPDGVRYITKGASWPGLSGDGDTANPSDEVPIHGQWARLPTTLDLSPSGPYPPFLRMVIRAIQKYGMVCTDSNNFVHAFNAEPGFYERQFLGVDPWSSGGDVTAKYRELNIREGRDPADALSVAAFPWGQTQWAPRHWGAPTRIAAQP